MLAHQRVHAGTGLEALVEPVPTAGDVGQARAAAATGVDLVVVVDAHRTPQWTVDGSGTAVPVRESGLRLGIGTAADEAARRALVRSPELRFRPLVCVDEQGRLAGVVRMERLVEALAAATPAPAAEPDATQPAG